MSDFITRRDRYGNFTVLEHSAKGSTWKDHKYIKKIGEGAEAIYKYATGELDKDYDKASAGVIKSKREFDEASKNSEKAKQDAKDAHSKTVSDFNWGEKGSTLVKDIIKEDNAKGKSITASKDAGRAQSRITQNKANYNKLNKEYVNAKYSTAGKIIDAVSTGKSLVDSVLEKLKKK